MSFALDDIKVGQDAFDVADGLCSTSITILGIFVIPFNSKEGQGIFK